MVFLKVEPKWNNLRNEPRFVELMRRMKFEYNFYPRMNTKKTRSKKNLSAIFVLLRGLKNEKREFDLKQLKIIIA
jgi:hypothetical protein